jgi:hypothetical protein
MKKMLSSFLSTLVGLVMIFALFGTTITYAEAPNYNIAITNKTLSAFSINISGNASATNSVGQTNDQHVTILWGDGQISEEIPQFNPTFSGKDFTGTWGPISHTYASAGPVTIKTIVHHAQYKGHESGEATAEINVVIPPATLTVIKHVVNTGGGTNIASNFSINVAGASVSPSSFAGSETGTAVSLNAGPYSVSENSVAHYTPSLSANCSGTISSGENKVCTIMNTFIPNTPPISQNKVLVTNEDIPISTNLVAIDGSIPIQTLTYSIVANPSHGVLSGFNAATGFITYTPNLNYHGLDSFTFKANDGIIDSNVATVSLTINSVNDLPSLSAIEDKIVNELDLLSFIAEGVDVDDDTLIYSISSGLQGGMSINSSSGVFTWSPGEVQGPEFYPITINVSDGSNVASQNLTIKVNEVNMEPIASDNEVSTPMNTERDVTLIASDEDLPVNILSYEIINVPSNGTVDISENIATYKPEQDFVGNDSFDFKVCDQDNACDTATVKITISNNAPVMEKIDNQTIDEFTLLSVNPSAEDPNNDTLTYSLTTGPSGASIDSSTGEFTWTPGEVEGPGIYAVNISVSDGAATDSQSFNITVNEVNVAPEVIDDTASTDEDTSVTIVLPIATDSDIPGQALVYAPVNAPTHGTAFMSGNSVLYTPESNYNGPDSFTYKVNDGVVDSNVGTINLTVNPVNDAPFITLNGSPEIAFLQGGSYVDEGASCTDVEDTSPFIANVSGSFDTSIVGTYTLIYKCVDKNETQSGVITRIINVQQTPAQCSDGTDNDVDQLIDMNDPGCTSSLDNDETNTINPPNVNTNDNGGGSGGRGGNSSGSIKRNNSSAPVGQVLGAETSCGIYVDKFARKGYKTNDLDAVKKVQQFLNDYMQAGLTVDGVFGSKTETFIKKFQLAHADKILTPWKITKPTGIFYITTQAELNNTMCPTLALPIPSNLIPFSKNPLTPKV